MTRCPTSRHARRLLLSLPLSLALSACLTKASAPHPVPVVDAVSLPATASIGADGLYDLNGTISFHGNTVTVSTIHVLAPTLGTDQRITGPAVETAVKAMLDINFPANNASGTTGTYDITVIDDSGLESAPYSGSVTLL